MLPGVSLRGATTLKGLPQAQNHSHTFGMINAFRVKLRTLSTPVDICTLNVCVCVCACYFDCMTLTVEQTVHWGGDVKEQEWKHSKG